MDYLRKKVLIFRDDDVFELSESFLKVHSLFMENNIPIIYAVIPNKLTPECTDFLKAEKKKFPNLIDITQHGFDHKNYGDNKNKYEFGEKRNYLEQKKDIASGLKIMQDSFGPDFLNIFVPPFHGHNGLTEYILTELEFYGFSSNKELKLNQEKLAFFKTDFSLEKFSENKSELRDIRELIKLFLNACKYRRNSIGINLHHEIGPLSQKIEILQKFINFLKIQNRISISFAKFSDFLKYKSTKKGKMGVQNITLELTNKCNLSCMMCDIWKEKEKKELSLDKIKQFILSEAFQKPIGSISLTGGECFLSSEFEDIFCFLLDLKEGNIISSIDIVSNGFMPELIKNFLTRHQKDLSEFSIEFSIDGRETIHNQHRGNIKSYSNLMKSLDYVRRIGNMKPALKFTITSKNWEELIPIYLFCSKNQFYFFPKFAESGVTNYYHRDNNTDTSSNISNIESNKEEIGKILKVILKKESKKETDEQVTNLKFLEALIKHCENKPLISFCLTPAKSLFVSCDGNIFPCLYEKCIANLNQSDWKSKIMNLDHQELILKGLTNKCKKCLAYHGGLKLFNLE